MSRVESSIGTRRLALLAFIAATAPLAIDLYLASFPAIQQDLDTSRAMVQLTLTAFLIGMAFGQAIWGPLSDRFGRRGPLLVSSAVTATSSFVLVLAPTIEVLIAGRFVQALSAAAGMVIARAMISDLVDGYAGVRALALMMTIHGTTPILAPALGGVLATFMPWRGILAIFAALILVQLAVAIAFVAETLPVVRRSSQIRFGDLGRVVRRPAFLAYGVTVGLSVGSMMAYVATSSFVYQEELGFTPVAYGVTFAVTALGMTGAGLLSAQLARRRLHPARTAAIGLPVTIGSGLLVVVVTMSPWPALIVVPICTHAFAVNLVLGNCMGLAMSHTAGLTGAGSATLGFFMFSLSAVASPLPELLHGIDTAAAMGLVMATLSSLAAASFLLGRRWVARNPASEALFGAAAPRLIPSAP